MRISDWSSDVCSSDLLPDSTVISSPPSPTPFAAQQTALSEPCEPGPGDLLPPLAHFRRPEPRARKIAPRARIAGQGHCCERLIGHCAPASQTSNRKGAVWGERVSVRVNPGGRRLA